MTEPGGRVAGKVDSARGPLGDLGIVVTRPGMQAAAFAAKIAALGARPIVFPTLLILPPADRTALDDAHRRLASFDFAVFVSGSAVEYGLPQGGWPRRVRAVAPGPGTVAVLLMRHVPEPLSPVDRFDSEGMLALPELSEVREKRFIVFRGNGGREVLSEELVRRGAHVESVECYRRARPETGVAGLLEAWRERRIDAVTITSSEGFANLWSMLDAAGRALLAATPIFAPHPRIAQAVRDAGCRSVHATAGGDGGLIAGLLAHFAGEVDPQPPLSGALP